MLNMTYIFYIPLFSSMQHIYSKILINNPYYPNPHISEHNTVTAYCALSNLNQISQKDFLCIGARINNNNKKALTL